MARIAEESAVKARTFVLLLVILALACPAFALDYVSIGAAKKLPPFTEVLIENAVVTADQSMVPGSVFVESANRSSGIRVITDESPNVGQRISFTGYLQKLDGEWQVIGADILYTTDGEPLCPLGVNGRALACDPTQTLERRGIDMTGMLITAWGNVTGILDDQKVMYVDDGTNYWDGLTPYHGIRVQMPYGHDMSSIPNPAYGAGIPRVQKSTLTDWATLNGRVYPPGAVVYVPCLWPIVKDRPAPPGPGSTDGIPTLRWDPAAFGHGASVVELQVLRDDIGGKPVCVVNGPAGWEMGIVKLTGLYGTGMDTPVTYRALAANPSDNPGSIYTWNVPAEAFGTTHMYQLRVLYREPLGGDPITYQYKYMSMGLSVDATAIEPVKNVDVVSPAYNYGDVPPHVYVPALQTGEETFAWNRKDGADLYYMRVEPVLPGIAAPWSSSTYYATGPTISLSEADCMALAYRLQGASAPGAVLRWVVLCKHSTDTDQSWVLGDDNLFTVADPPPVPPYASPSH